MDQTIMLLVLYITFFLMLRICIAPDTITVFQNITDGETIVSRNQKFELGFFSPGTSKNRYVGIWFKNTSPHTVVWVANPKTPIMNTSGMLKFNSHGVLSLVNGGSTVIWLSNSSVSITHVNHPTAQLLDTGNLVIKKENSVIWQSFDYPGDTRLPGMKMGKDFITGREIWLTSWKSADDPSPGEYTLRYSMLKGKYPQVYIKKNSVIESRIGPYNGKEYAGLPSCKPNPVYVYKEYMVINQKEMYLSYTYNSSTFATRTTITPTGKVEIWHLNMRNHEWTQDLSLPMDNCDRYGSCGPYGSCSLATYPNCGCLKGFELKSPQELSPDNWTSGCVRSRALDCGPGEGFLKISSMKLPDTQNNALYNGSMSLQECKVACKNNCSCTAYANPNIAASGVGCLLWFGDLTDVRVYAQTGQDLYVRLAASELSELHSSIHKKKRVIIEVTLSISAGFILLGLILAVYTWNKRKRRDREGRAAKFNDKDHNGSRKKENIELLVFSLPRISRATNNFSIDNKLGEGGFGPVYKGVLEEGQEIAVKRLSKSSRQGIDEFENEIMCIAKLQHRNLVKLLGYCIQGDETLLIYEYMPNKSLDWFIFDDLRKSLLDWPQRFCIIHGISRGLLYLHQDSRLRVVHRDLKAGNILLDHEMNPKISDFGLARMFKGHESEANTKRVVGTLGYISPEYAVNGVFSIKSDIFSFGVLVLEIVSGKKNRGFVHENHHDNLLGHAWRLYKEGKSLDLLDTSLGQSFSIPEVMRSIQVGLLCVQQRAEDRPTTPCVVSMLVGEGLLPSPKPPGFFIQGSECNSTSRFPLPSLVNGLTISQIEGR